MKLNFYQAWHYHKIYGEWEDNGMYDVPEADDNEEFQKWISEERKKNEEER